MARPKSFDIDSALDAAIGVFREHGFEGTSTEMLVAGMGIGRQSLYDTFGDKWQLYLASLRRYAEGERAAHFEALGHGPRAMDGVRRMVDRVVAEARTACLGVSSICEFGRSNQEVSGINDAAGRVLESRLVSALKVARDEGDLPSEINPTDAAAFVLATIAGLRLAARNGAAQAQLRAMRDLGLRALS